ncbi:VPS50 [Symbiodinium microadriaticum]|nr:VPS50 [Symbiodinium microadriaticum]
MLGEVKTKLLQLLPEAHKQTTSNYISDFDLIAGQLRSLVYRAMCPDLVKQQEILQILVEQSGWELKQMREEPHEWVDVLTDNCIDVWEYMEKGDEFAEASTLVREQVWLELCQCAFDTVLEGLSRVRKCSTEGRASMTMDVSALHTGLDHRHVCRPPRGRGYVDMYIKALYLTEDETVRWALSQCQTYAHRHLVGLLKQALSSMMSNRKLSQSLAALDAEYDELENEENKLTSMLSHRFG